MNDAGKNRGLNLRQQIALSIMASLTALLLVAGVLLCLYLRREGHAVLKSEMALLGGLTLGVIVLTGLLVWYITGRFTARLVRLTAYVDSLRGGDMLADPPPPTRNPNDEVNCLTRAFSELTVRLDESALKFERTSAVLEASFAAIDSLILIVDGEGRLFSSNWKQLEGVSTDGLTGGCLVAQTWPAYATLIDPERLALAMADEGEQAYERELAHTERICEVTIVPLLGGGGGFGFILIMVRDVTERHKSEEQLKQALRLNTLVLENAGDGIIGLDREAHITFVNQAASVMLGGGFIDDSKTRQVAPWSEERIEGEALAIAASNITNAARLGVPLRCDTETFRCQNGGSIPVEYAVAPIFDDDGTPMGAVVVFRDITDRRRHDQRLRELVEKTEEANRAKSSFLANMSHEIRTPLNAVLGFAQLLQRSQGLTAAQQRDVVAILRSGEHLLGLINDVLEMSKIEARSATLVLSSFDLHGMLSDIQTMFKFRAESKALALSVMRADNVPAFILTDGGKVRQVLINLVGNAIKFTDRGGVSVHVNADIHDGQTRLALAVTDTGKGMSPDDMGLLFKPFSQTRVGLEAQGGTGLGLAISREYARLMGGDITVASELGRGSTFTFEIPVTPGEVIPVKVADAGGRIRSIRPAHGQPRVLVVDDSATSREVAACVLRDVGFEVREAADGSIALEMMQAFKPRVVVTDISMPVMDGLELIRWLRREWRAPLFVVAATAHAFEEDRQQIMAAGADEYMRKPIDVEQLCRTIGRHLELEYEMDTVASAAPEVMGDEAIAALGKQIDDAVRESLLEAADGADRDRIKEIVDALPAALSPLAERIRSWAAAYDYDAITRLLQIQTTTTGDAV